MTDDRNVLAYIKTPIKAGNLVAMLSGEDAWELTLDVNADGVLVVSDD